MSRSLTTPIISSATRDLWKVAEAGEIGQLIELLARGADVNAGNQAGVTALMLAAYHGRLEMVRALTDHGADVNAIDKDGFSAAMLAQHSHREDIVRLLVARGARTIPKRSSPGIPRAILAKDQPSGSLQVHDGAEKKILDAPPNIWDVVHETHIDFDPRSAFFGHLKSVNPYVYALIAVIVGGGALLGFISFRGWSDNAPAASAAKTESNNNQVISSSPSDVPAVSSSVQQSGSQPSAAVATESPSPEQLTQTPGAARLASAALNPKITAATPKERAKRVVAKPVEPDQSFAAPVGGVTLSGTDKTQNSEKTQTSGTPAPKSDVKKDADSTLENKELPKTPTPAPVVPAKVRPTPNT